MAEEFSRNNLYNYTANSNLVLAAERDHRRKDEAKGEVETLKGKVDKVRMGERLSSKPLDEDKTDKLKKRVRDDDDFVPQKEHKSAAIVRGSSIIDAADDLDINAYTPKTKETKEVYEELLRIVQQLLGNQPRDILIGAAQEILSILKDDSVKDSTKQSQVEKILVSLKHDQYFKIVNIGKRITDFHTSEADNEEGDQVMGEDMAVVFDDDSGDEHDLGHENESDEGSDNEAVGSSSSSRQLRGIEGKNENQEGEQDRAGGLSVHDIDAHWLQRQLSKHFSDANVTDRLADEILEYLREDDERVCENNLVGLLEYDKFDLVRLLLKNRVKIYYCIRLKRCQTDEEKSVIENEMMQDSSGEGLELLAQIKHKQSAEHWTQDRIGEFANKARREVKALNKDTTGPDNLKVVDENDEDVVPDKRRLNAAAYVGDVKVVLEDLQFNDGNHLMTNTKCELPPNSWRASKKGYEEVHVPALKPVIPPNERLVEIADLPDWVQPAFPKMRSLNRVQSKMLDAALKGSDNLLLCAPTGAGKTNVALLCMLNQLGNYQRDDGTFDLESFKMVYIAPMKALVQEIVQSFSKRLEPFGVKVAELSGDQNLTKQQIQDTQLIVTTPEKWDIITRKSGDRTFTQLVRLVIIDEIHLLHDDRGPVLEALVARIIRQVESTQEMVRLVGLSATLPNYQDVATFLRVKPDKGLFFFDNSYRPVPLQQQYIGVTEKKALKRFQLMNEVCYEKVLAQAGKNQVLIFTHSRAETVKTASALRDLAQANDTLNKFVREDSASLEILKTEAQTAKSGDLKDLLPFGFAVHHAGMVRSDRTLVEDLFADKHVQVLVSTATLAWGVNLPCHTVIIKGTQMYSPELGRWVELSPLDIMQMLGRAGRYGLDTEGEGIIMTSHSELQYYLSLMNMQLPVESQFIKKLPDMLNAEVVLGAVTSVSEAATWLGYTYLYVRMLKNPALYGISKDDILDDPTLLRRRLALVHAAAHTLDSHGLIKYDRKAGTFAPTILGRVASHYYVSHHTIDVFNQHLKPSITEIELFRLFSLSDEFSQIRVREEEKQELAKLILRVPIPVKETVEEPSAKVNVLLQAYISRLTLEGFALVADMTYVQQSACRLMRALFDIALKRGWAALSSKLLTVCKMVEKRIWGSQSPLRQFGNIPEVIIRKLEKNSDIVWDRYFDLTPQDLGEIVKIPKMGKTLHKFVHKFPKMSVNAHILPLTRALLRIDLTLTLDFEFDASLHESNMLFWIVVEDVDGENILHHEAFILNGNYSTDAHYVNFTVQMQDPMPPQYFVKVVSDRWLHCETILPISFRNLLLPQKFPMPTELLDLQLLPVQAVNEPAFSELFPGFKYFNPIQTQTFNALHTSDENVLVCAPTGSGKTVCAEVALVRLFTSNPSAKCVYVAPKKELVESVFADWSLRLSKALDVTVVMLTGESTTDLALLNAGNVIVSTAVHWDMISRRWKQRKAIQNIAMYLFDELHLVGGAEGGAFEIVISRARYVASQLDRTVRIVGLSTSLSNAKDVADWMGATHENTFNFAPSARPVPLEIHVQTFETNQFSSRMLSMAKPAYTAIRTHAVRAPTIVFVPSRKQAQLSAIDFLSFAGAGGEPRYFLGENSSSLLAQYLPLIKDKTVAQVVSQGVGYLHPSMSRFDISILETLFISGVIQVLVVPHTMCWSVTVFAKLVVVMDTVYYEGREHRYLDYSISDLLQMIGRASRQGFDRSAKAVVLCHSPKREFLKKLLHDPLPIESHLDHCLHDHLNAEMVMKTIENKADAVDYLTWTFFYRRLTQNPNYYNLMGFSHRHLSDHLSELVETTVTDLENSKCIEVENDMDVISLNIGMIASHYYIEYTTVELFAASVTAKTKVKGVLDILSACSEFSHLAIRQGEVKQLRKLSLHVPFTLSSDLDRQFEDSSSKASLLLQCHFSRFALNNELVADQSFIVKESVKLLQALVDVVSSQGYLRPALAAMEMSQMIVQGLWNKDSVLLQIPHFTSELVDQLSQLEPSVTTVFDVIDLEDDVRNKVLKFSNDQISDIATFCNAYPNVDVSYALAAGDEVEAGDSVLLEIILKRDAEELTEEERAELGKVVCPRFPATDKKESWWLAVGDPNANNLIAIKRIVLLDQLKVKIEFNAPELPGDYSLVLYVMCDSYLGCDQEYEFSLNVSDKN